jgi:hypothetical protein
MGEDKVYKPRPASEPVENIVNFWKSLLFHYKAMMSESTVYMVEQTIKRLAVKKELE